MTIDEQKIDEAALALLYLTLHDECRAWKSLDWACLDRLHQKGFIGDPVNNAKSVVLTEQGLAEAERLYSVRQEVAISVLPSSVLSRRAR